MSQPLEVMELELHHLATSLELAIEGFALLIIAVSVVRTIPKIIHSYRRRDSEDFYHEIRLDLGASLALSLEFLLASDIIATAVTPTWKSVGLLAAISSIRTFLNYFLQKEVKELEAVKVQKQNQKYLANIQEHG